MSRSARWLVLLSLSLPLALGCEGALAPRRDARAAVDGGRSNTDAPSLDAPSLDGSRPDVGRLEIDSGSDDAGGCVPSCSERVCGEDGCGGHCGECAGDATCVEGRCEPPTESCPSSDASSGRTFPTHWSEGQCIFVWDRSDLPVGARPTIRAHYDGSALYASAHYPDGHTELASAGLMSNMGLPLEQVFEFCEEAPSAGSCVRIPRPTCEGIRSLANCRVLFGWACGGCSGEGKLVRIRVAPDGTRWTENETEPGSGLYVPVPGANALGMGTWPVSIERFSEVCFGAPMASPPCE